MKISTRMKRKSYSIYLQSLREKTPREAYIDLLESMAVSLEVDDPSKSIDIKCNKIALLTDEELIRIGMEIIKKENLSKYYDQLTHQNDFFYEFKETYNMYLKKLFEPVEKAIDDYNAYLSSIAESITSKFSEFKNVMASIAKSIDIELLRKKVNKAERFNNIAIDLEWFPAAGGDQLSLENVIQIVEMYESEGKEKTKDVIDLLFVQLYGADEIKRLYAGWEKNTLLKNRLAILREGVDAHLGKHFNASVCTILPQIEGAIRDIIPVTKKRIYKQDLEDAVASVVDSNDFNQDTKKFYFDFILTNFYHGKELPVFSRHAILHGEDTNFGTEVNSLKLILLFDFLQTQIAENIID